MWFVFVGCLLLAIKWPNSALPPTGRGGWMLLPFGLAVAWWAFADATGLTRARAMDKMEERKHERRERHMEALGLNWRRDRRVAVIKEARDRAATDGRPSEDRR